LEVFLESLSRFSSILKQCSAGGTFQRNMHKAMAAAIASERSLMTYQQKV
jgi:hypothetical protein